MQHGLTSTHAKQLLKHHGYNEIPEKSTKLFKKIFTTIVSPITLMLIAASGLSFILGKVFDGYFILVLLVINSTITLVQEYKADTAIKKLNKNLAQKIKVLRDEKWEYLDSKLLVPGDIIQSASGDIIPVDGKVVQSHHLQINESAVTGESLPVDKKIGDSLFSGTFIESGIATIQAEQTGVHTHFGKTVFSVDTGRKKSLLEQDILSISTFLTVLSLTAVVILTIVSLFEKTPFLEILSLNLSLIIAGIPISLPTVMTLIIEFGVIALATKKIIVRRLSALEDLANVNFLLTDKTGTLTKNIISVQDIKTYEGFTREDVITFAALIATQESDNPIDKAILQNAQDLTVDSSHATQIDFIPADSKRKRSTGIFKYKDKEILISIGAPQVIAQHCAMDKELSKKYLEDVENFAQQGYRTLAIAQAENKKEENMKIMGIIALSDTLRSDAQSVIDFLKNNGIGISMVTGDNRAIAATITNQLSLNSKKIVTKEELDKMDRDTITKEFFLTTGAFAQILPEDKLKLVQEAKKYFIVASNGDGVNDLPAVKAANVGIAVKNAVSALKATADIVLLSQGIGVIKDAIIESRKIFERLYVYSLYRISESLRLIVTITILGIFYKVYPLTALQIILLALLNDIPIISLASNRVNIPSRPAKINAKKRFTLSCLYGLAGIGNSLLLFFFIKNILNLDWDVIQTIYFLKLTVSGHLLIYVAHTKKRWWKFLPSKGVITATTVTQIVATMLAISGFLMPAPISPLTALLIWGWAFLWMQISEGVKIFQQKMSDSKE